MKVALNPESVYVVGGAGFWLKKWPVSDEDRDRRVFEAFDRKFGRRIEREKTRIAKTSAAVDRLIH
jgi:hypothetical protein